jgi:prephenate dehydrogenase
VSAPLGTVAVLGLGLLGGSVALAARARGVAARVVGAARRKETRDLALARGAVDEVRDFDEAVRDADLVVLATPLFAMGEIAGRVAPALSPGAVMTDVGSVKAPLAETIPGLLPPGVHYVGAHPMAGSHLTGLEHARADLFEGAPCVVTARPEAPGAQRTIAFWEALGARVLIRDPAEHDAQVAWISHAPHVLAFAFGAALGEAPEASTALAGPGFHDFTRIANGDPELWAEILCANRKALAAPLHEALAGLSGLAQAIEANDAHAVGRWIESAHGALSRTSKSGTFVDGGREAPLIRRSATPDAPRSAGGAGDTKKTHA